MQVDGHLQRDKDPSSFKAPVSQQQQDDALINISDLLSSMTSKVLDEDPEIQNLLSML